MSFFSSARKTRRLGAAVAVGAVVAAAAVAGSVGASARVAAGAASPAATCHLGNGVQHVIDIVFDNVHVNRDNPNVLSDIEQIPSLYNFITRNGTLLTNNHTPMIGHTANDLTTNFTGLYGDRQGMGVSNDYFAFTPSGGVTPSAPTSAGQSVFSYWTGGGVGDGFPQMDYSATVPPTGGTTAPPAPWVPFTRAGCNVGGVSSVNMELENVSPDIANVFGANSPEQAQTNADKDSFKDQEVNDYIGLAVHCAKGNAFCADAKAVKFGQTTPSSTAVADVLPDEPGGYAGYQAVFGHKYLQPILAGAANSGGNRTFGNGDSFPVTNSKGNLTDLSGAEMDGQFVNTPGFPGFGPITAAQTLAYTADMQESGVPVTYAYISDVHAVTAADNPSDCSPGSFFRGSPLGNADGPGDPCYYETTASYNTAFASFLKRLADDGITPQNTEFVFGADEGDHFAGANVGRAETPSCTGTVLTTTYKCIYANGQVGEVETSIHGLLQFEDNDAIPFASQPQGEAVYVTGNQPAPVVRGLERDFGTITVNDPFDGKTEPAIRWMADSTVEELMHFDNADPARVPTFSAFPMPDVYFTSGTADSPKCAAGTTAATAPTTCTTINNEFAWNHGYYAPEINNTWLGLVGPGVKNVGTDGSGPGDPGSPSSAGDANSGTTTDTQIPNHGTWVDQADVRPTLMALTGLKDDYVEDGRVITEDLTFSPGKTGQGQFQPLAVCYKQLNSSVGEFGTDALLADTVAMKSGSASDDSTYERILSELQSLGSSRDTLATQIKNELFDAEFNNTAIPNGGSMLNECQSILNQADTLAQSPTTINGNVTCTNDTYNGWTINGNVTVPDGDTCTLTGSTVKGNVQGQNGSGLVDSGSTIGGNVQTDHSAWIDIRGGSIHGNLQVQSTTGSTPSSVGDGSTANDICGASVDGNVQVQNNGSGAPFDIGGAPDCATPLTIGGNLQVQNNAGKLAIGGAASGAGNTVHGNINVQNNTGGGSLENNSAGGNCQLQNDSPGIAGGGNSAGGHSNCNTTA